MKSINFSEFSTNLKSYLDSVEEDNETLIIKRKTGKGAVLISLNEYNSIMETMHLLGSRKNADRLYKSIDQMKESRFVKVQIG
jgi:antitoxin YefM